VLALELIAIHLEEVRRLLRLTERFHAVLADFQRECGGDVVDALLDEMAGVPQQASALGRGGVPPGGPGGVRGAQRGVGIGAGRRRELAEQLLIVGGIHLAQHGGRCPVFARDVQRVAPAEPTRDTGHGGLEALMQLFRRIEHRGVGELETHE